MKLDGHARLTNSAIRSFKKKCSLATDIFIRDTICHLPQFNTMNVDWDNWKKSNEKDNSALAYYIAAQELSLFGEVFHKLQKGYLTREVVAVDLEPFKLPYHILESGQKFHFMRKSKSQLMSAAHLDASNLVKSKAESWLKNMNRVFFGKRRHGRSRVSTIPARRSAASELAIALHSLQDSFSPAHTERKTYSEPQFPGAITGLYVYATQNHEDHSAHDFESGSIGSVYARSAVHASAELMMLCAKSISKKSTILLGWEQFKNRWIKFNEK